MISDCGLSKTGNRVDEFFIEVFYQDVVGIGIGTATVSTDVEHAMKNVSKVPLSAEDLKRGVQDK